MTAPDRSSVRPPGSIMGRESHPCTFKAAYLLLLTWVVLLLPSITAAEAPPLAMQLGQEEISKLAKGEVIVKTDTAADHHKGQIYAAIYIDSPPPAIWNVMLDCEQVPAFVPGLKSCKVIGNTEESEIIEHQIKFSWFLPPTTYTFKATYEKYKRIDFKRISGGLKEFMGSWTLEPLNDGKKTMVSYSVYMDPGFLIPQWLVRRTLLKDLPDVLRSLRNRVPEPSSKENQ